MAISGRADGARTNAEPLLAPTCSGPTGPSEEANMANESNDRDGRGRFTDVSAQETTEVIGGECTEGFIDALGRAIGDFFDGAAEAYNDTRAAR